MSPNGYLGLGVAAGVVGLLYLIAICCFASRINLAIAIIETASLFL